MRHPRECILAAIILGSMMALLRADQPAKVTEAVNDVEHGSKSSATTPAGPGTAVHDGEYLKTGIKSRAEMLLPTTSVTRLGANTIFNYSADNNTIDLQAGTVLFCKPKGAAELNVKTAAIVAGIEGTTGFISVQGDSKKRTYQLGIIEGHAHAQANGRGVDLGAGDILLVQPGAKPLVFAYDVPRFVHSSPLLTRFKSTLPNQKYIEAELDNYQDEVSRGFITPPSHTIDYSGEIPYLAYDSAQNAQNGQGASSTQTGMPRGSSSSPSPPSFPGKGP